MSTATAGKVVTIHYTLKGDDGSVIDSSRDGDPLDYLHGKGGIVPGLERALDGKAAGANVKVTVAPEDGYGKSRGEAPRSVPRDAFPDDVELEAGMQFFAPGPKGRPVPVWVTEVHADHVHIATEHPLAGATLHFDVDIVSIRDATNDELAHGHAHGPDGHHHH
jgi:FKBP-type peptidyl-prolyl cis-trans isomerase SlyD